MPSIPALLLIQLAVASHCVTVTQGAAQKWNREDVYGTPRNHSRVKPVSKQQQQKRRQLRSRVVGGTDVTIGKYPFFGFWYGGDCGATLIHEDLFLTAAHCVDLRSDNNNVNTNLGKIVLNTNQYPNEFQVESIVVHPNYNQNPDEPKWDFALLKIVGTVPLTSAVPVALNTDVDFLTTTTEAAFLTTMGYGALREGSYDWAETLQEVTTMYIPTFPQCLRSYDNDVLLDGEICAGNYFQGGQDACQGKTKPVYNIIVVDDDAS